MKISKKNDNWRIQNEQQENIPNNFGIGYMIWLIAMPTKGPMQLYP